MKKTTPTADCIPDSTIVAYGLTPGRVSQAFLDRFEFTEMALPPPPASHQAPISPGRVPQEYLDRLGFAEMILSPPPASQQGYSSTPDVVSLSDVEDEWCNQELSEALAQSEREMMIEHKRREDEDGEKEASRREVMEGIRLSQEEKDVRRSRREDLRRLEVRREMDFRAVDGFSVQDEGKNLLIYTLTSTHVTSTVAQAMAASAVTYAAEQRRQTQRRRRQHQVQGQLLQTLAPRPSAAADVNTPPPLLDYFSPAEARKQLRAEFVPPSQSQHVPPWEPRKGKFYAVWVGRTLGVFTNWNGVEQSTKSFPGARQRSFAQHGWAKGAYEHAVVGNGLRDLGQWDGEGVWVVLKGLRPGVCVGK